MLTRFFNWIWYGQSIAGRLISWLFWPLACVFSIVSSKRRARFVKGDAFAYHPPVPVIVVGNISVGGTGKSPLTVWLIEQLRANGFKPGVVSRGYGGSSDVYPYFVTETDSPDTVGDEPLMIHLRTGAPVVVDPNRANAVKHLLGQADIDVVISDDGLQHYGLSRTVELVVVDGKRGVGNGHLLPMGPLREPVARLSAADAVVVNSADGNNALPFTQEAPCFSMEIVPGDLVCFNSESQALLDGSQLGKSDKERGLPINVEALAGIGNPQRFFNTLDQLGIAHRPNVFPDHHDYSAQDLEKLQPNFILTTEKDAVKLRQFSHILGAYLPVSAQVQGGLIDVILQRLNQFSQHHQHKY